MTEHYSFRGGTFDPVDNIDVTSEQEKENNRIERSENEYFEALRANDRRNIKNTQQLWNSLGNLSKSIKGYAEEKHKKYIKEEEARGAMLSIEKDYDYEDLQALLNEEEVMKAEHIRLSTIGGEIEKETGSFTIGNEVRGLSKWAQYSFIKNTLLREGKDYQEYKRQALDTVKITIDRGDGKGPVDIVGIKNATNQAEADAMEAKVRTQFIERFAGYSPVLLQATVKENIDTVDENDRAERAKKFDEDAKKYYEEQERLDLIDNVRASADGGRAHVDFWIEKNKYKYNDNIGLTRNALADHLYSAVESGELPLPEALGVVQERIPNRGTKGDVDMTHWKEWRTLESRLFEANSKWMKESEDFTEDAMQADAELLATANRQLTPKEAADYVRRHRELYPGKAIPDLAWNFLHGWENDDAMRQILNKKVLAKGGVTEQDLESASPTVYDEFKTNIIRSGQEKITATAQLGRDTTTYIRNRVANGLTLTLGTGETTSLEFDTLLKKASLDFVNDYNSSLEELGDPAAALKFAKDSLIRNVIDNEKGYRETNSTYQFTEGDKARRDALTAAQAVIKPRSGGWRVTKLPVPDEELEELKVWAATGGEGLVPSYYAKLAADNGLYGRALAAAQASLYEFESPKVDESKLEKLSPAIRRLLTYKPSPTSIEIAKKEYEREEIDKPYGAKPTAAGSKLPYWQQSTNLRPGL